MRIVSFVEGARPDSGGVGLVGVPHIAKSIADQGHQVLLVIAGNPIPGAERFLEESPARVFQAPEGRSDFCVVNYPAAGRWAFTPSLLGLYRYVRRADFVILHSLYSFPVLTGYTLARLAGKPYGLWPHGVLAPFQRQVSARRKSVYDRLLARRILDGASVLFFSAAGEYAEIASLGLRAPSALVPEGIDLEEFRRLPERGQFRAKYLGGHQGPMVLYLGRLNAKKGLDLLAESMAIVSSRFPDVRLVIVGGGDPPSFAGQVEGFLGKHNMVERTTMTGLITSLDKLAALADADVVVLPSNAENFGFAMFEAMASQRPVVVSDTINLAGEVERWGAGRAVPRDPAAFASAIVHLLSDEQLRQRMGESGLRLCQTFSWRSTGERVERVMESILRGAPIPADLSAG